MCPRKIISSQLLALALLLFFSSGSRVGYSQNRSAPVEVPFEFVHNQIVVEVKIAGKGPYSMLLDTDTDPSAIDLATARELGLKLDGRSFPASGGGAHANLGQLTRLSTGGIGEGDRKDGSARAIDLTELAPQ